MQTQEAEEALLKLAHLTRRFMHTFSEITAAKKMNLQKNTINLENELSLLQEFIDFQQMLYPETFIYILSVANDIDVAEIKIPPMLLQPFVENAISHGLIPKKEIGRLQVDISRNADNQKTIIRIIDDGIGMEQSQQLQQHSNLRYPSRGRKLTIKRIKLLNELGFDITTYTETSSNGTTVTIIL